MNSTYWLERTARSSTSDCDVEFFHCARRVSSCCCARRIAEVEVSVYRPAHERIDEYQQSILYVSTTDYRVPSNHRTHCRSYSLQKPIHALMSHVHFCVPVFECVIMSKRLFILFVMSHLSVTLKHCVRETMNFESGTVFRLIRNTTPLAFAL